MKIWTLDFNAYTDAALRDAASLVGIPLTTGQPLAHRFPARSVLEIRSKSTSPSDYLKAGPVHVVSSGLRGALSLFPVDAEFIELVALFRDGSKPPKSYYLMNLLATVDCLDREQSVFVDERGFATDISHLVVNESIATGHHMFRVARTIPSIIAVSEELAAGIAEAPHTGVRFLEPKDWKDLQHGR